MYEAVLTALLRSISQTRY